MKIITGSDRLEYEGMLQGWAQERTRASLLQDAVDEWKALVERLRADLEYERSRANEAVDALLLSKGQPPVSPPRPDFTDPDGLFEEDPAALRELHARVAREGWEKVMGEEAGATR